jgi:hypothetical protein
MRADKRSVAVAMAAGLIFAGCGKPQSQPQPVAEESVAPAITNAQVPAPPAEPIPATATNQTPPVAAGAENATVEMSPAPPVVTNETLLGGAEFTRKSLASPFAQADQALKEGYDAALIAFQIGDYARAAGELDILVETPGLTAAQQKAVQDLLAQTLKAAPELAPSSGTGSTNQAKPETPP